MKLPQAYSIEYSYEKFIFFHCVVYVFSIFVVCSLLHLQLASFAAHHLHRTHTQSHNIHDCSCWIENWKYIFINHLLSLHCCNVHFFNVLFALLECLLHEWICEQKYIRLQFNVCLQRIRLSEWCSTSVGQSQHAQANAKYLLVWFISRFAHNITAQRSIKLFSYYPKECSNYVPIAIVKTNYSPSTFHIWLHWWYLLFYKHILNLFESWCGLQESFSLKKIRKKNLIT